MEIITIPVLIFSIYWNFRYTYIVSRYETRELISGNKDYLKEVRESSKVRNVLFK